VGFGEGLGRGEEGEGKGVAFSIAMGMGLYVGISRTDGIAHVIEVCLLVRCGDA